MKSSVNSVYVRLTNYWAEIRDVDRERGLTTTEVAVLTFVLVAIAAAVGAILYGYATDQAENLPTQQEVRTEIEGGDATTSGG